MKPSELFSTLHQNLSTKDFANGFPEIDRDNFHKIGSVDNIEIAADFDFIYANKNPIIFNYNDDWTAISTFKAMMEALYPKKFTWIQEQK